MKVDDYQERAIKQKNNTQLIKQINQRQYQYIKNWTQQDDNKLKDLVINDGILIWQHLANHFNVKIQQVMARWIKIICPKLKNNVKIGGALKWSPNQDHILYGADRAKIQHLDLMFFLPYRTVYSIQARWRRMSKNTQLVDHMTLVQNKVNLRRQVLKKIALKKAHAKKDAMTKIYDKQRQFIQRVRIEQQRYQQQRRQQKRGNKDRY